jgi:Flp pilus assembly protein TadD
LGEIPRAVADYEHVLELAPNNDDARIRLAEVLLAEKPGAALKQFKTLHERLPDNREVTLGLARALVRTGERKQGGEVLEKLACEQPKYFPAQYDLGTLAQEDDDWVRAEKHFRAALEIDRYDYAACHGLAHCLQAQGRVDEAKPYFADAEKIRNEVKRLDELSRAAAAEPGNLQVRLEAGQICLRNGQSAEAIRWFSGALQIDPKHEGAREALAKCYEKMGRKEITR